MAAKIRTDLEVDNSKFKAKFRESAEEVKKWTSDLKATIGGAAGAMAAWWGGSQIAGGIKALAQRMDDLDAQAKKLQLPIEDMQILNQVAEENEASVEELTKALVKVRLAGEEAAAGSAEKAKAFATLGIEAGKFVSLSPVAQLEELARGFGSTADQGLAFAAVMKIVGKSGYNLIPLLKAGGGAIAEMRNGLSVMSASEVQAVAELNDRISRLSAVLKNELSKALVDMEPALTRFVRLLSEAARGWAVLNDPAGGIGDNGGMVGAMAIQKRLAALAEYQAMLQRLEKGKSYVSGPDFGAAGEDRYKKIQSIAWHMRLVGEEADALRRKLDRISEADRALAEQNLAFERMSKAGMPEDWMRRELEVYQKRVDLAREAARAEADKAAAARAEIGSLEERAKKTETLAKEIAKLNEAVGQKALAMAGPAERLDVLKQQMAAIVAATGAAGMAVLAKGYLTGGPAERKAALEFLDRVLDLKKQIADTETEIRDAADKQSEKAESDREKQAAINAARDRLRAEMAAMDAEAGGNKERAEAIRREAAIREDALAIAKELNISEAEATTYAMRRAEYARQSAEAAKQEAKAKAAQDVAGEINVLRLRAAGRKAEADALEQEIEDRAKAKEIAERTGWTEAQALAMIREKHRLQREIDRQADIASGGSGDPLHTPLRRSPRFRRSGGHVEGASGLEGARGLGRFVRDRRARETADPGAAARAGAAKYYERSLALQEETMRIWKKLGIA